MNNDIFEKAMALVGCAAVIGGIFFFAKKREEKRKKDLEAKKKELIGDRDILNEMIESTVNNDSIESADKGPAYTHFMDLIAKMDTATTAREFQNAYNEYAEARKVFLSKNAVLESCYIQNEKAKAERIEKEKERKAEFEKYKTIADAIIFASNRPATVINNGVGR